MGSLLDSTGLSTFILENITLLKSMYDASGQRKFNAKEKIVHIISPLRLVCRGVFRKKFSKAIFIYEASNLTKWRAVESVREVVSDRGFVIVPFTEGKRTISLITKLNKSRTDYFFLKKRYTDLGYIFFFLKTVFLGNFGFYVYLKELYSRLYFYKKIIDDCEAKIFITSNDDEKISPIIAGWLKILGVKTVNVTHGRSYLNDHFYDISIVQSKNQILFLKQKTKSKTSFCIYNNLTFNDKIFDNSKKKLRILFFDQPPDQLLEKKILEQVLRDLKCSLESVEANVAVKLHPASPKDRGEFYREKGFKCIDPNLEFSEIHKIANIGISICSTAGLDLLQNGVPILYLNYNNILEHYSHIWSFKKYAVSNLKDLKSKLKFLDNKQNLEKYFKEQIVYIKEEFRTELSTTEINQKIYNLINIS